MEARRKRLMRVAAAGAVVLGLAAGSYGVASAASGSASGSGGNLTAASGPTSPAPNRERGRQRSDETLLTGDTASKVQAAAVAKVSGGTVVRVETDADGNAAYEVHMVSSDGTPVTVYVDKQFDVVRVETGMPGGPGQRRQA